MEHLMSAVLKTGASLLVQQNGTREVTRTKQKQKT